MLSLVSGIVSTEIDRNIRGLFGECFYRALFPFFNFFALTPLQGAQTTLYCCLEDKIESESGGYYAKCKREDDFKIKNGRENQKLLWEFSMKAVGLKIYEDPEKLNYK